MDSRDQTQIIRLCSKHLFTQWDISTALSAFSFWDKVSQWTMNMKLMDSARLVGRWALGIFQSLCSVSRVWNCRHILLCPTFYLGPEGLNSGILFRWQAFYYRRHFSVPQIFCLSWHLTSGIFFPGSQCVLSWLLVFWYQTCIGIRPGLFSFFLFLLSSPPSG